MRCASFVFVAVLLIAGAAQARDLAVDVINASKPTKCAETDNVYVKLQSPDVRSFRVEATHPHYLKSLKADSVAPAARLPLSSSRRRTPGVCRGYCACITTLP